MTQEVRGLLNKSKHAIKVSQDLLAKAIPPIQPVNPIMQFSMQPKLCLNQPR